MRLNHILFVILVTFLFAGSATSASPDSLLYDKICHFDVDLQESSEGDDDTPTDASIGNSAQYQCSICSISLARLSDPVRENRFRLVSYPILPQAPPAKI